MPQSKLNPRELTGRAATHVCEVPELGSRLHVDAVAAVLQLRAAAARAGIELAIVSSFRDFERQTAIWNGKYRGERPLLDRAGRPLDAASLDESARVDAILLWSALPGASRHHWGTDFDVIDRAAVPRDYRPQLTAEEFAPGGPFAPLNDWLGLHLARFGFFRPYTTDRGGVQPEPWHLSYAPLAGPALADLTLDVLYDAVEQSEILGRAAVLARLPEIHARYVMAVDPA
ncbi:MAG TPA: M15 family metallopeptidase [Steroidobacteraceae bacterium]|nr:M15 family metallopeptidase [Steroidobacteraceae bacterium]